MRQRHDPWGGDTFKRQTKTVRILCVLICALMLAAPLRASDVTVFAASSLKDALDRAAAVWRDQTGGTVRTVYGGTSALARQIVAGAPADVFLSASPDWMDVVDRAGLLVPGSRVDLLGNRLVVVGLAGSGALDLDTLPEALGQRRLATALVDAVPAGQYARAALVTLGLWQDLRPHLVETDSVRAALVLVELGEAPFGIVYATDAAASTRVSIVASIPADAHPRIVYPLAVLHGPNAAAGQAFATFLRSPAARDLFRAAGFEDLP